MVTRWCILLALAGVFYCEDVYVEVSVVVSGDYNVSDLYENLYNPNTSITSNLLNTSNSTGNVLNVTNFTESNHTLIFLIPFVKNSVYRVLSVSPILCVIGYDFNCFNDTNVTRLPGNTVAANEALPMGYILGTCAAVVVVVILGVIFTAGFKKKPIPAQKKLVIPVVIDWPPRYKKPIFGNGMPVHSIVTSHA